jgi:hypothetical protein
MHNRRMGSFSYLNIGSRHFSWRSLIPPVVGLLFEGRDYESRIVKPEPNEPEEADSTYFEHVLFTTCAEARRRLERLGISRNLLRDIHFTYFGFDYESYVESLDFRASEYLRSKHGQSLDDRYIERFEKRLLRRFEHLSEDAEFERVFHAAQCHGTPTDYFVRLESALADAQRDQSQNQMPTGPTEFDRVKFHRDYLKEFLDRDPYLDPLDEDSRTEPGLFDIETLYHVGLCVFASEKSVPIELNFGELIDQEGPFNLKDISEVLLDLQRQLAIRTSHTQAAFGAIARKLAGETVPSSELLATRTRTTKQKGDLLEKTIVDMFSQEHGFGVRNKHRRGDEEIDLVIVNRQLDPFWLGLQSPVIIAECRNRTAKVRARDLRDFETKLRNSGPLCRLGLMVSTSGFTRECLTAIKRLSREGYRIVLVDQRSLNHRLVDNVASKDWLEALILEQF